MGHLVEMSSCFDTLIEHSHKCLLTFTLLEGFNQCENFSRRDIYVFPITVCSDVGFPPIKFS